MHTPNGMIWVRARAVSQEWMTKWPVGAAPRHSIQTLVSVHHIHLMRATHKFAVAISDGNNKLTSLARARAPGASRANKECRKHK
jgi:hypothetical protein